MSNPRQPYFEWNEQQVETLKVMYAQGHSASFIAKTLGARTRNQVIGKAHRLGLDRPESPTVSKDTGLRAPKVARIVRRANQKAANMERARALPDRAITSFRPSIVPQSERPAKVDTSRAFLALDGRNPVDVEAVAPSHCRWPIDCPDGITRLCGADREGDARYCGTHLELAFRPQTFRTAAQAKADRDRRNHALLRYARRFG